MPPFCFSDEQIAASATVSQGPGWNAMIEGARTVSNGLRITVYLHDSKLCYLGSLVTIYMWQAQLETAS